MLEYINALDRYYTVYIMSITQSVGMVADKFENCL